MPRKRSNINFGSAFKSSNQWIFFFFFLGIPLKTGEKKKLSFVFGKVHIRLELLMEKERKKKK